jgi:hypothetical protein
VGEAWTTRRGVERGRRVLSSTAGSRLSFVLAPVSLAASSPSQLGLTRRRMRPKPFGAISCIPDGASPASTLASTSLPRHCTGNQRSVLGSVLCGIIHNARRARHAACLEPMLCLVCCCCCCRSADHKHPPRERLESLRHPPTPYITPPAHCKTIMPPALPPMTLSSMYLLPPAVVSIL